MKKKFFFTWLLVATCLFYLPLSSQVPQACNYQAVVRNTAGLVIPNQLVNFRMSIIQGGPNGAVNYEETDTATTNAFGLATLDIGNGTPVSGSFSLIDWSLGSYLEQPVLPARLVTLVSQGLLVRPEDG
jgi:hypothetical protein